MTLRALVVFESMFGNTEKVAAAVAHGLQLEGIDTGLVEVHAAPATLSPDVDLLVVGGADPRLQHEPGEHPRGRRAAGRAGRARDARAARVAGGCPVRRGRGAGSGHRSTPG